MKYALHTIDGARRWDLKYKIEGANKPIRRPIV